MDLVVEKNLAIDAGREVALATDVYRPAGGAPVPVLLLRTPYNKDRLSQGDVLRMAQAGYAVVCQDTRGSFASGGVFTPFEHEADDGAAMIAWAAAQPWSSGAVGTIGASYVGATQWLAATNTPPALQAMAPFITTDEYYESWTYQGGAFQLGFALSWALNFALAEQQRRAAAGQSAPEAGAILDAIDRIDDLYRHRPLIDMPLLQELAPYYREWLEHPSYDRYWQASAPKERYEQITAPALNIGGWYDGFLRGTLANYRGMKQRGGSARARSAQRLVIGPWSHGTLAGFFPDREFGARAGAEAADLTGTQIRWFDARLKSLENGLDSEPPVRLFVMGINRWRDERDWPPPDAHTQVHYLHSQGNANSRRGSGTLSPHAPAEEPCDRFLYDPLRPVPTVGGATLLPGGTVAANAGPRDQRAVQERDDVLCYTSEVLQRPLEVIGHVGLTLHVASSARDTDFTAALLDVGPDDRAVLVTDGILRARYRESLSSPTLMNPGQIYELQIDLGATAMVFAAGHRLRLAISSSNFPRFDRNTNTGGEIAHEAESACVPAVNSVFHDRMRPSQLLLPCVERN